MFKTVGIYQNIQNPIEFEQYYVNKVLPRIFQMKGVVELKLTSLKPALKPHPEEMNGIQLLIETYFESEECVQKILTTDEGKEIMGLIMNRDYGELGLFLSHEKVFKKKA